MKVALAGAGAFGVKHLEAIAKIDGVQVVSLIGRTLDATKEVATRFGVGHVTTELDETLRLPGLDAVILATPTQLHASQTIACLKAGKHVQVEIPLADRLADAEEVARVQKEAGKVAMVGHTRRFNPSHQWVHRKIVARELSRFSRWTCRPISSAARTSMRWARRARGPTTCCGITRRTPSISSPTRPAAAIVAANAVQGPIHPELGIAMDMSIQLKSSTGAICTLSLSFNNDGPLGTFFRYICDNGTYIARYDDLFDGKEAEDRRVEGGRLDERHRAAGPRVLRRDTRRPRAQRQRRAGSALLPHLDKLERQLAAG